MTVSFLILGLVSTYPTDARSLDGNPSAGFDPASYEFVSLCSPDAHSLIHSSRLPEDNHPVMRTPHRSTENDDLAQLLTANPEATSVDFSKNDIEDEGASLIATAKHLKFVYLQGNLIGDRGAAALSRNETISTLSLASNPISEKGVQSLVESKSIRFLNLSKYYFGFTGAPLGDVSAEALARTKTITTLCMGDNSVGDKGAEALSGNSTITTLYLDNNHIGPEGAKAFTKNHTLTTLYIAGNPIGKEGLKALQEWRQQRLKEGNPVSIVTYCRYDIPMPE